MLYAVFDTDNRIVGLSETPVDGAKPVNLRDPDVLAFLSKNDGNSFDPDAFLDQSDKTTIRILEDLIDTLTANHLIRFTDLPEAAQQKLLGRKLARQMVREEDDSGEASGGKDRLENGTTFLSGEDDLF